MNKTRKHVYIPDTQITPTTDTNHIIAAGNYINDKKPDVVIIGGDWWDMPSLCSYDKPGSKGWESKDVKADFECGTEAMNAFLKAVRGPRKSFKPEVHLTLGNHENRAVRAQEDPDNQKFKQYLSFDNLKLDKMGVQVHPFLDIAVIDGIMYSHYFNNPDSKMSYPITGSINNRLWKLGQSFTCGHEQVYIQGQIYTALGQRRRGLVCGRFYQEDLEYLGPQKSKQSWSGILMKHEVRDGDYDLMEVSMEYLLEEWQ